MSVTLAKLSDSATPAVNPFGTRQWLDTVRLAYALYNRFGDSLGVSLYEGLADNDLTVLRDTFPRPFVNYPTALPSQGSYRASGTSTPVDYSDGYGGEYAVGE
jgi:hypothetical protein